jgi:hypothetical protein
MVDRKYIYNYVPVYSGGKGKWQNLRNFEYNFYVKIQLHRER